MKVRDKDLKVYVNVYDKNCLGKKCYWARPDPGVFTQGQGYKTRKGGTKDYLCGTREIHGCPD